MNKLILLTVIGSIVTGNIFGQCNSLYSFTTNFETVNFFNQSNVSNAHYFWNFGDGSGSNNENPIHRFPETGNFLVTLFTKDTVSNCSAYYESWINVLKYSSDSCQTYINDSIFFYNTGFYLTVIDSSTYCNNYNVNYDAGPSQNSPPNNWISLNGGWGHARFLSRVQYYTNDTINGYVVHREAYKSSPFFYSSAKNYGDSSANFEFTVISQDSLGQTILFRAMNNTASFYEWHIIGFGNVIISNSDTISKYYPYSTNNLWLAGLITIDTTGYIDTLFQNILIIDTTRTLSSLNETVNLGQYNFYPNPLSDFSTLDFQYVNEKKEFSLYNSQGQLVKYVGNIENTQVTIYRENLPNGLYYFVLSSKNKIVAKGKLIIE